MPGNKIDSIRRKALIGLRAISALWFATLAATAATLTVSNVNDSGAGSLRQAILDANATNGLDTIVFQIPVPGVVHTITLASALPAITDPAVIDATTEGNTNRPLIELNGGNTINNAGLRLLAGNSTIRGLAINRFLAQGILLQGPGTNLIAGNFIGTDPSGTIARANGLQGIWINGSPANLIGGTNSLDRNLISGNGDVGVYVVSASGNVIVGNYIGLAISGTALANAAHGVALSGASGNKVGGASPGSANLISGNSGSGVYLSGSGTSGNTFCGNLIGTDASGGLAVGNGGDGVTMLQGASNNTIGGTNSGTGNIISGNGRTGIDLEGPGVSGNIIEGDYIGLGSGGTNALGNGFSGVALTLATNNQIGGTVIGAGNVISGNKQVGVYINTNSAGNLVAANLIGVNFSGTAVVSNNLSGITIAAANSNVIGGSAAVARNIISGNGNDGVQLLAGATANQIQGNYIGTDATGQTALPNQSSGLHIESPANTIGGTASGAGNVISGNNQQGVILAANTATLNIIQGNLIGTDSTGTRGVQNHSAGIELFGAAANYIGGSGAGAGNVISANGIATSFYGIYISGSAATGNVIQGNKIGTDITGTLALGNASDGLHIDSGSSNIIGGSVPGAGNLISGNGVGGLYLANCSGTLIQGNLVGTGTDGISPLANLFHGVDCRSTSCNMLIGGGPGAGNVFAFAGAGTANLASGVRIRDGATNIAVLGNSIFSDNSMGIDLGPFSVNLPVDCETGGNTSKANMLQNCPVLTQAVSGSGTGVRGYLDSSTNRNYLLQFFASPACNGNGYGQGKIYLGDATVTIGTNCTNGFLAALPAQVPQGYAITATATDSANNTSEFSACVPVTQAPTLAVATATNQSVSVSWATNNAAGFVLEQTGSLTPPVQWTAVTNAPVTVGGQFVVTMPAGAETAFFVLVLE